MRMVKGMTFKDIVGKPQKTNTGIIRSPRDNSFTQMWVREKGEFPNVDVIDEEVKLH